MANTFCRGFAALDAANSLIQQHLKVLAKYAAECVLSEHLNEINVECTDHHVKRCKKFAIKIMVNVFYNNEQQISSDQVRKEMLAAFKKRQQY